MNLQLKQRLVGATVLVIIAVIFLPMILKRPAPTTPDAKVQDLNLVPYQKKIPTIPPEVIARYEADIHDGGIKNVVSPVEEKVGKQDTNIARTQPSLEPVAIVEKQKKQATANRLKEQQNTQANKQWIIQLGSFSNQENAERMVKRLKQQRYMAYLEDVQSDGKVIYRVRIGPVASKENAGQIKQKIDQQENLKTLIMKYK